MSNPSNFKVTYFLILTGGLTTLFIISFPPSIDKRLNSLPNPDFPIKSKNANALIVLKNNPIETNRPSQIELRSEFNSSSNLEELRDLRKENLLLKGNLEKLKGLLKEANPKRYLIWQSSIFVNSVKEDGSLRNREEYLSSYLESSKFFSSNTNYTSINIHPEDLFNILTIEEPRFIGSLNGGIVQSEEEKEKLDNFLNEMEMKYHLPPDMILTFRKSIVGNQP